MTTTACPRSKITLRPTALAALLLLNSAAWSLPENPTPTFGQTLVSRPAGPNGSAGTTLRIDQTTAKAGIDWTSFSIGAGESVRVVQLGPTSLLVSRVTGLDPSVILGRLDANGRVFLTNPRGVIFGAGAQVDVGGLVATTLRLGDADAQAGRLWLQAAPRDAGAAVVNDGSLRATGGTNGGKNGGMNGGTIALVAPQVVNRGNIDAKRVGLAAVSAVQLDLDGDGLILFNARPADAARLDQLGRVVADGGRAELVALARGQVAGTVLNLRGAVFSRGLSSRGGAVVIDGGTAGIVEVGAVVDVSSAAGRGGDLLVLGQKLLLGNGAQLDASGRDGGGRIRVGGDFQGRNPEVPNAERVTVLSGARLSADAGALGDGGQVVMWSDLGTRFFGQISARGGALGGDGGSVEVSGKAGLDFQGRVDLGAARGRAGTLLLDPLNITVQESNPAINGSEGDLSSPTLAFSDFPGVNSVITVAAVNAQLVSSNVTLEAGNTITVAATTTPLAGSHGLTLRAGGNINVNGNITATGGITLSANDPGRSSNGSGAVLLNASLDAGASALTISSNGSTSANQLGGQVSGGTLAINGDISLSRNTVLTVSEPGTSTISGNIGGGGGLTKQGPGTLTLTGANTYTGATTVSAGTLALGSANLLPDASAVSVASGATLALSGNDTVASLNLSGTLAGTGTLTAANYALTGGTAEANLGAGTLTSTGTSTLNGTANAGTVGVQSGRLTLGSANRLSDSAAVTVALGATLTLNGNDTVGSVTSSGTINGNGVLSAASFNLTGGTYSNDINTRSLTNNGNSLLTGAFSGSNVQVQTGTLTLGSANRFTGTPVVDVGAAATLALGGNETFGSLSGGGTVALGTATLATNGGGSSLFSGVLSGDGSLSKLGATTTLTLTGNNRYTGVTQITAGTLTLGDGGGSGSLGTGPVIDNGTLRIQRAAPQVLSNLISGSGNLLLTGPGNLTLTAANSYAGGTTLSGGRLVLSGSTAQAGTGGINLSGGAGLDINNGAVVANAVSSDGGTVGNSLGLGTLAGNLMLNADTTLSSAGDGLTVSGVVSGGTSPSGLIKTGAGTVTLTGANFFGGATLVNAGTLVAGAGAALGSSQGSTTVSSGATLVINNVNIGAEALNLAGSGVAGAGALQASGGAAVVGGSVTLAANTTLGGTGNLNLAGSIDDGGQRLSLTKVGSGTVTLSAASSYTGTTAVLAGSVALGVDNALASSSALVVDGGTLNVASHNNTVASVALRSGTLAGSGGLLSSSADFDLQSGTVSAALGGSVGLNKTGTGTVTLSGANNFSGSTTVNAGVLALGASNVLPAGLRVNGGTLDLASFSDTVSSLILQGGTIAGSSGVLSSSTNFDLRSGTVSATLGGSSGLNKTGADTVTLAGTNTYTGATTVSAGRLVLDAAGSLADSGALAVSSGAAFSLGGRERIGTLTLAGTLDGGGTLSASTYSLNGGQVNANLGTGALSAAGSNQINGTVAATSIDLNAGSLNLGAGNRLTGTPTLTLAGGTLMSLSGNESISTLSGNGNIALGSNTLSTGSAASSSFGGVISGSGGLVKQGSGALTLTNAQTFVGPTVVSAGKLVLPSAELLSDATALSVASGAFLDVASTETVANFTLAGTLTNNGTVNAATYTLNGGIANANLGPGVLTNSGGSSQLNGVSAANLVAVTGGVLTLGAPNRLSNAASLAVGNGADLRLNGNQTVAAVNISGRVGGSGTLSASTYTLGAGSTVDLPLGSGTLSINGDTALNQPAGATVVNINAGTLALAATAQLANTADVTVAGGAALNLARNQTIGTLTLIGSVGGSGALQAANLASSGNAATVNTALTVDSAVKVETGTLTVGNGATAGSLSAPSTTVNGSGVLNFNRSDAVALDTLAGDGTLRQSGGGTLSLTGSAAGLSQVQVSNGNLALAGAGGDQLSNRAQVTVGTAGTLTLGAAGERIGTLALSGQLNGSAAGSTLTADSYALSGGKANANLGGGKLSSIGNSSLNATAAVSTLTVAGGTLAVTRSNALTARPGLEVQPNAALTLAGNQQVGAVSNAGALNTGSALLASDISSPGAVNVGGSITTTGNQSYGGVLRPASATVQPALVAGGDITAVNLANDFSGVPLALQARSVQLLGGGHDLSLGTVALGDSREGGSSTLSAQGLLLLQGKLTLAAGELNLESLAAASNGATAVNASGQIARLTETFAGEGTKTLVYAAPLIQQSSDAAIHTAAGSRLRLRAVGGGSIELLSPGNVLDGSLSAVTSSANLPFVVPAAAGNLRISRIAIRSTGAGGLHLVKAVSSDAADSDALRADVIELSGTAISTAPDAAIHARLPYSLNQGPATQLPGLLINTGPAGNSTLLAAFGTAQAPIHVQVDPAAVGLGGLYLTVLPEPLAGTLATQVVYLGCVACSTLPIYQYGGNPAAVQTFYNGSLLGDAPLAASAINSSTTLLENARRALFEAAVRTENVAPRLRAGVIAEVGKGRSAVEGGRAARRPELCEPTAGTLACADTPTR